MLRALAVTLLLFCVTARVVHAQASSPPLADQVQQQPPHESEQGEGGGGGLRFPGAEDIARAIADQLGRAVNHWVTQTGLPLVLRGALALFGLVAGFGYDLLAFALGRVSILYQLPAQWTYELDPVQRALAQFSRLALAGVGLASVLTAARIVAASAAGLPAVWLGRYYVRQAAAGFLLWNLLPVARWGIDFANALANAVGDPRTGVLGLGGRPSFDRFAALDVVLIVYAVAFVWFVTTRAKVLVFVAILLALSPAALLAWVLPLPRCEALAGAWATLFAGLVLVQVGQAACLNLGAVLMASAFAGGDQGTAGPLEGVLAFVMGVGALQAAGSLPGLVTARVGRGAGGPPSVDPGVLATAVKLGVMAAGVGITGGAAAAGAGVATVTQTAGASAAGAALRVVEVRSLLGDAPKLLPPPRD